MYLHAPYFLFKRDFKKKILNYPFKELMLRHAAEVHILTGGINHSFPKSIRRTVAIYSLIPRRSALHAKMAILGH